MNLVVELGTGSISDVLDDLSIIASQYWVSGNKLVVLLDYASDCEVIGAAMANLLGLGLLSSYELYEPVT